MKKLKDKVDLFSYHKTLNSKNCQPNSEIAQESKNLLDSSDSSTEDGNGLLLFKSIDTSLDELF